MGWPRCCVVNCKENKKPRFRFPHPYSDAHKRFGEWVKRIGDEKLAALHPMEIYRNKRICYVHFDETSFFKLPEKLLRNAIPTIFPSKPANAMVAEFTGTRIFVVPESGNSDEEPSLEDDPLGETNEMTETASPPPEEACPANKDFIYSSSEVDLKPDVDTLFGNESEQMRADRERIMKHPYECCRLCLERSGNLTDIFQGSELGLVMRQAIKDFLHFEVVRNGESPWHVCYTCMQKLSEFQEFKDRCVETKILWDDCSKYIDESTSANNAKSNETQVAENIRLQPESHSKPDIMTGGTVNLLQHAWKEEERTGNEIITTGDRDLSVSKDNSVMDMGGCVNNVTGIGMDRDAIPRVENIPSVIRTPHNSRSAEVDGEQSVSHLNPMHNQRALEHQNTEPSSLWPVDKENSTAIQVKGMYELDDSKGSNGEPLVLILRVDGAVELRTLSEIPLNMRARIQKYSKMTENLTKKRPREKGD